MQKVEKMKEFEQTVRRGLLMTREHCVDELSILYSILQLTTDWQRWYRKRVK